MRMLALFLLTAWGPSVAVAQDTTPPPPTHTPAITVEAALARSVVDRQPQDTGTAFPADVGQIVLWTRVSGAGADEVIHHVWFHGDGQVADVELRLGGSPWRTWSRKTIPPEATGAWSVEVRSAAGDVLQRIAFTIG